MLSSGWLSRTVFCVGVSSVGKNKSTHYPSGFFPEVHTTVSYDDLCVAGVTLPLTTPRWEGSVVGSKSCFWFWCGFRLCLSLYIFPPPRRIFFYYILFYLPLPDRYVILPQAFLASKASRNGSSERCLACRIELPGYSSGQSGLGRAEGDDGRGGERET